MFTQDDLIACLALSDGAADTGDGQDLTAPNLDIGYHRVFGGQILAQVVTAAAAASPDKALKSLHILFPREGNAAEPMQYRVDTVQSGRTFATTEVVAHQHGKVVAVALVSLHADEDGIDRNDPPPQVGPPEDAVARELAMIPWETRIVDGADLDDRGAAGPARLDWWMRTAPVGGARDLHQALLAHATDLTVIGDAFVVVVVGGMGSITGAYLAAVIGTALRPVDGLSQADSTVTLHTAVTSHTVWFHRPFRVDDWLLISQAAPVVAHGRAWGRGDVFAGDRLVASFAQESMIRRLPSG